MTVIDDYLDHVTPAQRKALEHIRKIVKDMVPDAEEVISYGMPTLKQKSKTILHFAAFKDHMSVFPTADPRLSEIGELYAKFRTSKGTLQFSEENPIPDELIREIVKTRLESTSDGYESA